MGISEYIYKILSVNLLGTGCFVFRSDLHKMVIKGSEILEVLHQIPEVRSSLIKKKDFPTLSSLLEMANELF
jgi:hypothetical protein